MAIELFGGIGPGVDAGRQEDKSSTDDTKYGIRSLKDGDVRYYLDRDEVGGRLEGPMTEAHLKKMVTGQMGSSWSGCNYTRYGDTVIKIKVTVGHVKSGVAPAILNTSSMDLEQTTLADLVEWESD